MASIEFDEEFWTKFIIFPFSLEISGTFIALDRLLQQIRVVDYVDIFNIVYTMRKGTTIILFKNMLRICSNETYSQIIFCVLCPLPHT